MISFSLENGSQIGRYKVCALAYFLVFFIYSVKYRLELQAFLNKYVTKQGTEIYKKVHTQQKKVCGAKSS